MKKKLHIYLLVASLLISSSLQLIDKHVTPVPGKVALVGIIVSIVCLMASMVLWVRQLKNSRL